tara:strand:+ start:205 stop:912 length:708 start_codon:yes stop_codon:yes gene_type:complete
MIPKLIEIKDLTPFKGLIIDVSKIPVTRYLMKKPCAAQFNMLPEGKFFLHTTGSYWLKGKGPNKEGYQMLPPFENNPEETGTKCFPWVARKRNNGEFTPCKLSKGGNGYPNVRFQITVEDLKEQGREDLIGIKKACTAEKSGDRWPRNEGVRGLGMTVGIHTLVGYALFPQYFQTPEIKYIMNHKSEVYDYRLSQLSLLTYENNYDLENLKRREETWLREIFGRRQFSTGGLVGG